MVVYGVCNALTLLVVLLLVSLPLAMYNPGLFDRQRAGNASLYLLDGGLSLIVVVQLDRASVRTVLLQVVPVRLYHISASDLTVH